MTLSEAVQAIIKAISPYQKRLQEIKNEILIAKDSSSSYWLAKKNEVIQIYENIRLTFAFTMNQDIKYFYDKELTSFIADMKRLGFEPQKKLEGFFNSELYNTSMETLFSDSLSAWEIGVAQGEKTFIRLMNTTQQSILTDTQIDEAVKEGFIEGGSPQSAKKFLLEKFKNFTNDEFVTVINKNGKPMNFKLTKYAEMVARTKIAEAQTIAALNSATYLGTDLVEIPFIAGSCDICQDYENQVYSITGNTPGYPVLDTIPPFHPNCVHRATPAFEEMIEIRKSQEVA